MISIGVRLVALLCFCWALCGLAGALTFSSAWVRWVCVIQFVAACSGGVGLLARRSWGRIAGAIWCGWVAGESLVGLGWSLLKPDLGDIGLGNWVLAACAVSASLGVHLFVVWFLMRRGTREAFLRWHG